MRWSVVVFCLLGTSCALAKLGEPENGVMVGRICAYRGYFEEREDCTRNLRKLAARSGATHLGHVTHTDYVPSGVSYHVQNDTYDGCCAPTYREP